MAPGPTGYSLFFQVTFSGMYRPTTEGHMNVTEYVSTSSSLISCGFYPFTKDALGFDEDPVGGILLVYATFHRDSKKKCKKKLIHKCSRTKLIDQEATPVALEIDSLYKL